MSDQTPEPQGVVDPPVVAKANIFAEVWEEDRPTNKVIIGDVLRCIFICFGTTLSSWALYLAPGLSKDTKEIIELVHNIILTTALIAFAVLLFTELMIIRIRRLKALAAGKE